MLAVVLKNMVPCIICSDGHSARKVTVSGIARYGEHSLPVNFQRRLCDVTGETWENAQDIDWRSQARSYFNRLLGRDEIALLAGMSIEIPENM